LLHIVTGCAGFIGSHLTDRLLEGGSRVVGIDCFRDYYPPSLKRRNLRQAMDSDSFRLLEADLSSDVLPGPRELTDGEPFIIYHLAAQAGVRHSWGEHFSSYLRDNVQATQSLLEWCLEADGLQSFVFASSSSVYGDTRELPMNEERSVPRPYSPYGVTKLAAEHLVSLYRSNHGLPAVSCRLFSVYGPRQRPDMAFNRFIRAGFSGEPVTIYGTGEQTRDFTYVDDVVEGLLKASRITDGGVFNLGGGNRVSLNKALNTLQEVMGIPLARHGAGAEQGDVRDTWAETFKAIEKLGWNPRVSLEEGLRAEVSWFERNCLLNSDIRS